MEEHEEPPAAAEPPISRSDALAAAVATLNARLQEQAPGEYEIRLEDALSIKQTVHSFHEGSPARRVPDWQWLQLYHRRSKKPEGWLFSLRFRQRASVLAMGTIQLQHDYVAVDRIERRTDQPELKGNAAPIALAFAEIVARTLGLRQVRINDPFNELLPYYEQKLGFTPVRHADGTRVQYLYKDLT